jgi:hypothetical protein
MLNAVMLSVVAPYIVYSNVRTSRLGKYENNYKNALAYYLFFTKTRV